MKLVKQKSKTVEEHIKRLMPETKDITVRESTNGDIAAITIVLPTGTIDFSKSQFGGDVDVSVTVPQKQFTVSFEAFGVTIAKAFDTADERDAYVETLPDEQKTKAAKTECVL